MATDENRLLKDKLNSAWIRIGRLEDILYDLIEYMNLSAENHWLLSEIQDRAKSMIVEAEERKAEIKRWIEEASHVKKNNPDRGFLPGPGGADRDSGIKY